MPAGARIIDAQGRVVAPGFIDPHSHGDPLITPAFENFLAQGVTTITLGQDGSSPVVEGFPALFEQYEALGLGVNVAMFVGHGSCALRRQLAKTQPRVLLRLKRWPHCWKRRWTTPLG